MIETPLGIIFDEFDWGESFTKPIIAEFPFIDDVAFSMHDRIVRLDNINVASAYEQLGLTPSNEGVGTTEAYVVEIMAIQREDFQNIIKKIREACNTYHGIYFNKVRLVDIVSERRIANYYGKGLIECNKAGFEIYD